MVVANLGHENGIPGSLPQCGVWLFFSFLPQNVQNMSKTHTRRDFSKLFDVTVLWRQRWITSWMGLFHPPGLDNISPDVKIGGYSCLKNEKEKFQAGLTLKYTAKKRFDYISDLLLTNASILFIVDKLLVMIIGDKTIRKTLLLICSDVSYVLVHTRAFTRKHSITRITKQLLV